MVQHCSLGILWHQKSRPLIVAVDCENGIDNVGLEKAMTWVRGVDTEGIYKLNLGFNVFAYMQSKDAGQMGDVYETDLHLQRKQALTEEEPRAASLDSLKASDFEKFMDMNQWDCRLLSSMISSGEEIRVDTAIRPEVSSLHDRPCTSSFSNTVPSF